MDVSANGTEIQFINSHPTEFQPVVIGDLVAPGKSQVWNAQQWIDATVADFQQFDVIVFSDTDNIGSTDPLWNAAVSSRAVWGSAINGNIFITSGDPVADVLAGPPHTLAVLRVLRQGIRFAAAQAGNAHGRTGLYVALDHLQPGETLGNLQNGVENPTDIELLSWFGSFRGVRTDSAFPLRLITQNPILNVLGTTVADWVAQGTVGFHAWPAPFVPIAYRIYDPNPTPTNNIYYAAPCEADTGYEFCAGQSPIVSILVKAVNLSELTRLVPAQCSVAVNVDQTCNFSAFSTIVPDPNPNNPSGPSTQVSWWVVSGPNAGKNGFCARQMSPYGIPGGVWSASYVNTGTVTANNFQDVVQLFLDYDSDKVFDDMFNSSNSPTDPNNPAPGVTIEYGTTFTVNWARITPAVIPQVTITKLPTPAAAAEPATDATFRLTRTGTTALPVDVKVCLGGTAIADVDYELRVGGSPVLIFGGETTITIQAGLTTRDVVLHPLDDTLAEGTETVRLALKDVFDLEQAYVVGGNGFAECAIVDNDQPVITVSPYIPPSEQNPNGVWIFQAAAPVAQTTKIYFTFGGTANHEVDYVTALPTALDDSGLSGLLASGIGWVTLSAGNSSQTLGMNTFQDSRTEGTESATLTLIAHPSYKAGTSSSGSVNITDDDSPKIPASGYTITDLGDYYHTSTYAVALNNNTPPQVAGNYIPYGSPTGYYLASRFENGTFTDIPPLAGLFGNHLMLNQCINGNGWMAGSAQAVLNGNATFYYYLWDGNNTVQLQTPDIAATGQGPRAINDAGWIVGSAMNAGAHVQLAMSWDQNGNFIDLLGLNPNNAFSSFAWALSSSATGNRVAGESQIFLDGVNNATTTAFHAFRTQPDTQQPLQIVSFTDDLGNALASETSSSGAYAVNNLFEIGGYSAFSATERRAAYKDGNSRKNLGWRTLGVLSGGAGAGLSSQALGINDGGLIVGWSRTTTTGTGNPKAVVWENYQAPVATDLNLKIPVADRPNWLLQYATGINMSGKIVGYGLKGGQQRAFLLTPIP